ncbi:MAG: Fic family protein [Candidatus Wildermuthbacteria bacterium]|nr:Fic family protein [Candidatus Wildermuthbacteria bacterium]
MYPTIEEKAAHLLYFIVKNHPFVDGNKRAGAYRMSPVALTALTLLIAESDPKDREKMTSLVVTLLSGKGGSK